MAAVAALIDALYLAFVVLMLARSLIIYTQVDPYHPAVIWLYRLTEPILQPIRKLLSPNSMLDISPFIALLLAWIIRSVLIAIFV